MRVHCANAPAPSMNDREFSFGCVLLAAGASLRMGQPKQLLPIAGRPLIARAATAALASPAQLVIVVLGANEDKVRPALAGLPVTIAINPEWREGMAASIRAGLDMIEKICPALDAVLLAPVDQPAFSSTAIARLAVAFASSSNRIAAARYGGRFGTPAIFGRVHFEALKALRGDEGARALLRIHSETVAAIDLPELAVDIDTPADYERLRKI